LHTRAEKREGENSLSARVELKATLNYIKIDEHKVYALEKSKESLRQKKFDGQAAAAERTEKLMYIFFISP